MVESDFVIITLVSLFYDLLSFANSDLIEHHVNVAYFIILLLRVMFTATMSVLFLIFVCLLP